MRRKGKKGTVIARCANPACCARFDHRIGGKFFRFHLPESCPSEATGQIHNTHNVVHYCLCPLCSKIFTLASHEADRVVLHLLEQEFAHDAPPDASHLQLTAA